MHKKLLFILLSFICCQLFGKEANLLRMQLQSLREAIVDLSNSFPDKYDKSLLTDVDCLQKQLMVVKDKKQLQKMAGELEKLKYKSLLANPLLREHSLLFVARKQYLKDHHNTATLFQKGEINWQKFTPGGALKIIDFANGGRIITLLDMHGKGVVRDPDVHFDGKKILFSMRKNIEDDYHIYEINVDGSGLQQLTFAEGCSDIDPCYLPSGKIVFTSTREPKFCMCNRHIMGNLFCMDGDGANIHQIGKSTLFEGHSSLLDDGRIIYDRWEYVDRNFGDAQGLWVVNPDGTHHAIFWGNNTASPGGVIDPRIIPGSELCLCIFTSCHDCPWGSLAIIDRKRGVDGRAAVIRTWPKRAKGFVSTIGTEKWDAFRRIMPKYEDPFPLSSKYFLVSRTINRSKRMGIYLLDVFGNEILLHSERLGCFDPMPICKRKRAKVLPTQCNFLDKTGKFYIQNVYIGTHMKGVKKGSVKYLRIVEIPSKHSWTKSDWEGQGAMAPAMNWHDFNSKRILGTVPVEVDGSAYFEVPADTFFYFQLLDKNKQMIQSMRSGTMIQSGEVQGCIGCHENRVADVPFATAKMIKAMQRPANKLNGWYGKRECFNYLTMIQPIFNSHCLSCHDYGKKAAKKLLLAPDYSLTFNASYNELWRKGIVHCIGAGPAQIQQPYTWGASASGLLRRLRTGHNGVKLSKREFDVIATWLDLNAPYYPTYNSAFSDNLAGRSPLNDKQLVRLAKLTGIPFLKLAKIKKNRGPQISFLRPELSRCLLNIADKNSRQYKEALAIIIAGKKALQNTPRAGMPRFVLCGNAKKREMRYKQRLLIEEKNRKAIRTGKKYYDNLNP